MKRFICSLIALVCVFSFICFTSSGSTAKADKVKLPSFQFMNPTNLLQQSLLQKAQNQRAQHTLTISGASYPKPGTTLKKGKSFELKGLISSNDIIHGVYAVVFDAYTYEVKLGIVDIVPLKKSVQIYTTPINTGIKFGKLPAGTFTLIISAATDYVEKTLVNTTFHVK